MANAEPEGRAGGEVHLGPMVRTCSSLGLGGSARDWGEAGAGLGWQPGGEEDEESDMCLKAELTLLPIGQRQVKERKANSKVCTPAVGGWLAGWGSVDGWQQGGRH